MEINVLKEVLEKTLALRPDNEFIKSLNVFYKERGGLSKKQMEGLHSFASKIPEMNPGKLATLEAIIKKRPNWQKHNESLPAIEQEQEDVGSKEMIETILEKFPQHKRVLFFKSKIEKNEILADVEKDELKRFKKLLIK